MSLNSSSSLCNKYSTWQAISQLWANLQHVNNQHSTSTLFLKFFYTSERGYRDSNLGSLGYNITFLSSLSDARWIPRSWTSQPAYLPYFEHIVHCKNFWMLSSPHISFKTTMVAGTSNWNIVALDSSSSRPAFHDTTCFLASCIAALVAQWTETASVNGGSHQKLQNKQIT